MHYAIYRLFSPKNLHPIIEFHIEFQLAFIGQCRNEWGKQIPVIKKYGAKVAYCATPVPISLFTCTLTNDTQVPLLTTSSNSNFVVRLVQSQLLSKSESHRVK